MLRKSAVWVVFGVMIAVTPAVTLAPKFLFLFYQILLPNWSALPKEWRTDHAGESVLPARVRTMIAMLRRNDVTDFSYSEGIAKDPEPSVPQRLAEGAYPIKLNAQARHRLLLASEPLLTGCAPVDSSEGFVLAQCP